MNPAILGIDPGAKGAIAMIQPMVETWDLPESPADLFDLLHALKGTAAVVYLEKAQSMPGMGVAGAFNYGKGYGRVEGVLAALRVSVRTVSPSMWKRTMGVTADKAECRTLARQLFPEARITRSDHAEALLLAEWGRRQR